MTAQNKKDDIFMLQVRLFRLAQIEWNLSAEECDRLFKKYFIPEYIETCYEEYHVQGDEANLNDIRKYIDHMESENESKR